MICQTVPLNFLRLGLAQLAWDIKNDVSAEADVELFFAVEWPRGFELEELCDRRRPRGPGKVKATSHETRGGSATIELTFAPRVPDDPTTAADALGDSVDYLREIMIARGFDVEVEPGSVTTLGGLPAVETRLVGVGPAGQVVRQWTIVALSESQAYSLSFTGTATSYRRHLADFTRTRATLLLA